MENLENIIRRVLNGEKEFFGDIVQNYQNLVYTVCYNIVRNSHDAENMAQEAFISAYRALNTFKGGEFKSWLCRIAVNKSLDFKRKQSKILSLQAEFDLYEYEIQSDQNVEREAEKQEEKEKVNRLISSLPEKYSLPLTLFYYNRLSVKEIAANLKIPEKTVETRLYRAKKLMKERWGKYDP